MLQRTLYKKQNIDLSSAPRTMHEFFAGSGLVAYGLKGMFAPIWSNDISEQKAAVYEANFGCDHFELGDIKDVNGRDLPFAHLSWASFPCQDLSLAGSLGGIHASRSGLVWEWLRVLDEMKEKPRILALENVTGLLSTNGGDNYRVLHMALVERGYDCGAIVLNASHFVPQSRPRVFVIAVQHGYALPAYLTGDAPCWLHSKAASDLGRSLPGWIWWQAEKPPHRHSTLKDIIEEERLYPRRNRSMPVTAVDLFCGVGGLTHGLQLAGLPVIAGFDIENSCRFAYEHNNNSRFLLRDVTQLTGEELRGYYPNNTIKVLVGCAPCQPFSTYSLRYNKHGKKDDKWRLLYYFANLVKEVLPEVVSMENVPQLSHEQVFRDFVDRLESLGYHCNWRVVNCAEYGVPQCRKRLVLLASRLGDIELIPPLYDGTHYRTVREAIGNLPMIEDGTVDPNDPLHRASRLSEMNRRRIRQSIPGGSWHDWDDDLKLPCHQRESGKGYRAVYGRMEWDKPSPTITTQYYGYGNGRFGHPEQNRALSMREGALLQSFPPDYQFIDPDHQETNRSIGVHIGNAVPVELGRAIGVSILQHLENMGVE